MFGNNNTNTMGLWNPANDNKPLPMIYTVKKVKGQWTLVPEFNKFKLPKKLYGKIRRHASRIWNSFSKRDMSIGTLFIGDKGTGKTETAKVVCNMSIDNGMPVIMIKEIRPDIKLISFLGKIENAVLFIDEYGKQFRGDLQDKSLTMFSDIDDNNKLFLLTENDEYLINRFLLNRPSRLWYRIRYGRLEESVVKEYCEDYNVHDIFIKDLVDSYKTSKEFSFDHLQALVTEHLDYPDDSLKDMLEIMNVDIGITSMVYKIISIKPIKNKDNISLLPYKRKYPKLEHMGNNVMINTNIVKVLDESGEQIDLTKKPEYNKYLKPIGINNNTTIHDITESVTTYKTQGYLVKIKLTEDDGVVEEDNIISMNQPPMNTGRPNIFNKFD